MGLGPPREQQARYNLSKKISCNHNEKCFDKELKSFIKEFCEKEAYKRRGFVSEEECKKQYPPVFFQMFESGNFLRFVTH